MAWYFPICMIVYVHDFIPQSAQCMIVSYPNDRCWLRLTCIFICLMTCRRTLWLATRSSWCPSLVAAACRSYSHRQANWWWMEPATLDHSSSMVNLKKTHKRISYSNKLGQNLEMILYFWCGLQQQLIVNIW